MFIQVIVQQLPNNTWWPRGYGDQPLLDFVVSLALADTADNGERGLKTSQMMRRVGLKTVELVRQPVQHQPDKETFFFRINGVDVYAKGMLCPNVMRFSAQLTPPPPPPQGISLPRRPSIPKE